MSFLLKVVLIAFIGKQTTSFSSNQRVSSINSRCNLQRFSSSNGLNNNNENSNLFIRGVTSTRDSCMSIMKKPFNVIDFTKRISFDLKSFNILKTFQSVFLASVAFFLSIPPKIAHAAQEAAVKGWDLYGRVPNDDWLFSNWRLTDPNMLKRTLTETLRDELPSVFGNFKRKKRIHELISLGQGVGYFAVAILFTGLLYKGAVNSSVRRKAKLSAAGIGERSVGAIAKKGPVKGVLIDNMGEGWYDMEKNEGENDKDNKNDDDDDDEDEDKDVKKKK
eukprot:gene11079-23163_t